LITEEEETTMRTRGRLHRPGPRPAAGLVLLVGTVAAIVVASAGATIIRGTPKGDTLRGSAAADKLYGNAGNDKLYGLAGSDYLNGGPGNDLVSGGPGADTLLCGAGRDTAVADPADKVDAHVDGGVLTVCMHPQVIGRGHRIAMLDELIGHCRAAGARFERMADVAQRLG
jgi:hypothetical protein